MHPEVESPRPGGCPKCGVALESLAPVGSERGTEYVCPMHPEVVEDRPALGVDPAPLTGHSERLRADGQIAMYVAIEGRAAGLVGVADAIKASTPEAVAALHGQGLKVVMLTGDHWSTARGRGRQARHRRGRGGGPAGPEGGRREKATGGRRSGADGGRRRQRRAGPRRGNGRHRRGHGRRCCDGERRCDPRQGASHV